MFLPIRCYWYCVWSWNFADMFSPPFSLPWWHYIRGVWQVHVQQVYAESAVLFHTFFHRERRDPSCQTGAQWSDCYAVLFLHLQSRIKPGLPCAVLGFGARTTCASGLPWVRNTSSQLWNGTDLGASVATRYWAHISHQEFDQRSPCLTVFWSCIAWSDRFSHCVFAATQLLPIT